MKLPQLKMKGSLLAGLLLTAVTALSGCQWEGSERTSLKVSVGFQSEQARFANRASLSSVYPSIGTIWLSIETPTLSVAQINEQYNNGQLTLNSGKTAIKITDTAVSLNVPTDETLTVSLEAFNLAELKVFSGSTEVTPDKLGGPSVQVNVPIQADIDASVPVLSSTTGCTDTDTDGFCDVFEDLFVNASGVPDIDGDTFLNSNDPDSDGDGVLDADDKNLNVLTNGYTPSNNGFPMFIVPNSSPVIGDLSLTILDDTWHSLQLPSSSDVDADLNDEIRYVIKGNLPLGIQARVTGQTLEFLYTGLVLNSLLTQNIQIDAYDLATDWLIESPSAPTPTTFNVQVNVSPGIGVML